jgi:phosphatidate cytidylyltransferase
MKTRVIAAAALLPLLLLIVLVLPKVLTAVLFGAAAAIGAFELLSQTQLVKHVRLLIYSSVMAFIVALWSYFGARLEFGLLAVIAFFAAMFGEMMADHIKVRFKEIGYCMIAGLILPYMLTSLVRIHTTVIGRHLILVPFVLAFMSDIGAYFAGRTFGHHKLAPVLSPNKTIEGVVGGVLSAILGMVLYTLILDLCFKDLQVSYAYAIVYGILGSAGAVFGDLCFSVIKRQTGIKDYGNLIPGHGGILDRFDSMMIVGPLAEALILLIPVAVKVW